MNQTPETIIESLRMFPAPYQREVVDSCMEQITVVGDRLIAELEAWLASEDLCDDQYGMFPHYAMEILAQAQDVRLHPIVLSLLRIPKGRWDNIMGEFLCEDISWVLARTSGGDFSGILGILQNETLDGYVRWAALDALVYGVVLEDLSADEMRREIGECLSKNTDHYSHGRGLSGDERENLRLVGSALISVLCDLHPGDQMATVRAAFTAGAVDTDHVALKDLKKFEDISPQVRLDEMAVTRWERFGKSVHDRMGWWASFSQEINELPKDFERVHFVDPFAMLAKPKVNVGRNDPCPCGSGKKYKKCCLGCI